jgi:hypothetical protein
MLVGRFKHLKLEVHKASIDENIEVRSQLRYHVVSIYLLRYLIGIIEHRLI